MSESEQVIRAEVALQMAGYDCARELRYYATRCRDWAAEMERLAEAHSEKWAALDRARRERTLDVLRSLDSTATEEVDNG